ncbi:MAG: T9SS type A sorting domain-containing protein, partial [Fimbriimonadaceae bacterium]|nr:T9SS type A sorting domain-containing protein [Chitinophagales bacterium]
SMYDLTGKLLKEFSNTEIQSGKLLVGGFANGTYQLKIKTEQGVTAQKLLIAR